MAKQVISFESARGLQEQVTRMEATHKELDARLKELGRRTHLTASEQREVTVIKKRKLQTKDQIAAMRRAMGA